MNSKEVPLEVTYDPEADGASYVYLAGPTESRQSAHQVSLDSGCGYEGGDILVLDFDSEWRLIGIEALDGNGSLPKSLVEQVRSD